VRGVTELGLAEQRDGGSWGALIAAPESEAALPEAYLRLAEIAALPAGRRPLLAAVHGGTELTRRLLCEQARMAQKLPALLVEPEADRDQALTAVLSGRADLVGVPA
jgi:anthraniloyl-CoA monooxygenase